MSNDWNGIDPRSVKPREVVAIFLVDGKEYCRVAQPVEEFAVPHVVWAASAQVQDPDVSGAIEALREAGLPLPKGY